MEAAEWRITPEQYARIPFVVMMAMESAAMAMGNFGGDLGAAVEHARAEVERLKKERDG